MSIAYFGESENVLTPTSAENHDHKRRRIAGGNQDKNDEELTPEDRGVSQIKVERLATEAAQATEQPTSQASDDRRIRLVVTTAGNGSTTFAVKASTIDKIASLSKQLKSRPSTPLQRQVIECSTISGDEAVIQAIELLEGGILNPLPMTPGTAALLQQLSERIKLFDISQELDIGVLEIAVIENISAHSLPDAKVFAQFATACYDRAAGHRVDKKSSLGQLVKIGLSRLLPDLTAAGIADDLRNAGGPLGEEMIDVVWTRYKKLEQLRFARLEAERELLN